MSGSAKICNRVEFPRIGRVLTVEVWSDEVDTITVSRSDNAKLLRLKKFTDYNEAMNYYSELLTILKVQKSMKQWYARLKCLAFWKVNSYGR